jgi:DMSO/TMAO reductase YedYZ molybdopterin-dependent catalytic subunit
VIEGSGERAAKIVIKVTYRKLVCAYTFIVKERTKVILIISVLAALILGLSVYYSKATENQTVSIPEFNGPPSAVQAGALAMMERDPASVDNTGFPVTPIEDLNVTGNPQHIDMQQYRLAVTGSVDHPLSLDYDTLLSYPAVTQTVLLICPGAFVDNAQWTGVEVKTLLEQAGLKDGASKIYFVSEDGFSQTLTPDEAVKDGILLAYAVDGQTLPIEHGYPLRLVAKGHYGSVWVKWLAKIEVK